MACWLVPARSAEAAADSPPDYGAAQVLCRVEDERLNEASGLAVTEDRLFMVNDGGTSLQVYVLDHDCQVLEVRVPGGDPYDIDTYDIDPYDIEDLALAPDGALWLADLGDNKRRRDTVALAELRPDGSTVLYRMTYPDGPHDCEALLLDPGGRPYLVTKDPFGASAVYTPAEALRPDAPTALRLVVDLRFRPTGTSGGPVGPLGQVLVTGGAVSPDGRLAVLRTYTDAYLYAVADGDLAAALATEPVRVALPAAPQGEAVAFGANGRDLVLSSEGTPFDVTVLPARDQSAADANGTTRRSSSLPVTTVVGGLVLGAVALAALRMFVSRHRGPA